MKWLAALVVVAVLAGGCGGSGTATSPRERGNVRAVSADDPGIRAARRVAQRRWPDFATSFRFHPERDHHVKVAFPTRDGSREHLWVFVTAIRDDRVTGTIANDPVADIGHLYGDKVTVARRIVEDWRISRNGRLVDGYFSRAAVAGGSRP